MALMLTIRDGAIVQKSILACDQPTDDHPANLCEPIRQYYSNFDNYAVEDLFDIADHCTLRMRADWKDCPAFEQAVDHNDISLNELIDAVQLCPGNFKEHASVCTVDYEANLGYPMSIFEAIIGALDGRSSITVKAITPIP